MDIQTLNLKLFQYNSITISVLVLDKNVLLEWIWIVNNENVIVDMYLAVTLTGKEITRIWLVNKLFAVSTGKAKTTKE